MSRTYRKEYKGEDGKRSDRNCRNNGHRPHCTDDRLYSDNKWRSAADEKVLDYYKEEDVDSEE